MKHFIFLTTLPYYKIYKNALVKDVTPDSQFFVTSSNFETYQTTFNTSPFFSKYYVITATISEYNDNYYNTLIKWSQKPWVIIAFQVGFMESFRVLIEKLKVRKVDFVAINCYKIPDAHKIMYIRMEVLRLTEGKVKLSDQLATMIISRAKGSEAKLDNYLTGLASLGFTKKSIYGFIKPVETMRIQDVPMNLLLGEKKSLCIKTIYRYRHSGKLLRDTWNEFYTLWEDLYAEYRSGRFTRSNYISWLSVSGKKHKVHSEFMALRWLSLFQVCSYGYMLDLNKKFTSYPHYDWYNLSLNLYLLSEVT